MKKNCTSLMLVLGFLFLLNSTITAQNLVPNAGFETRQIENLFMPHWGQRVISGITYSDGLFEARTGYLCGKITSATNEAEAVLLANYNYNVTTLEPFPCNEGETFKLSVYAKTSSGFYGSGVWPVIKFLGQNGDSKMWYAASPVTSSSYTKIEIIGVVPKGAAGLTASIYCRGIGTAYVDDVELIRYADILADNADFEGNVSNDDLPDYWNKRNSITSIEEDFEKVYSGRRCALFNNTGSSDIAYLVSRYGQDGNWSNFQGCSPCSPGDVFRVSCHYRTDSASFSGNGIRLRVTFADNDTSVSTSESPWGTAASWTLMSHDFTVPAGCDGVKLEIRYEGVGKAWVDAVKIEKNPTAPAIAEDSIVAPSVDQVNTGLMTETEMVTKFHDMWTTNPYGDIDGENFSNAARRVIGLLLAAPHDSTNGQTYINEAEVGADYIVSYQKVDGTWDSSPGVPPVSEQGKLYVGGLCTAALSDAYVKFGDTAYKIAAKSFCNYVVNNYDRLYSPNMNMLAVFGMARYYRKVEQDANILAKAVDLAITVGESLNKYGYAMTEHDNLMPYHAIIIRGFAELYGALPSTHPARPVIKQHFSRMVNAIHTYATRNEYGNTWSHILTQIYGGYYNTYLISAAALARKHGIYNYSGNFMEFIDGQHQAAERISWASNQRCVIMALGMVIDYMY
jgi:hypothetical protein